MDRYDALVAPDPAAWLSLDESERIELVDRYHAPVWAQIPRPKAHASVHVIVENQLAEHVPVVEQTLERLLAEGLDRHQAIHAISFALAGHLNDLAAHRMTAADPNEPYYRALQQLQADQWRTRGQNRAERRALRTQQRRGK
jgi:hypothetical protein